VRALGLTSGGLDSLLSLLVIQSQGIEVLALTFMSPFLSPDSAVRGVGRLGIPHRAVEFTDDHLAIVKAPRFGRGANMNPCLDCHTLMIRWADRIRREEGFHFIFTGEVLGQRPMSQNKGGLDLVARFSGAAEHLLRPLSAKLLPETRPEMEGWIDRSRLYDIQGRSRKVQMALAEEYGLKEYPNPAGGCPLTEPQFSRRLKQLWERLPQAGPREIMLLRHGRHFDLGGAHKLIVGRSQAENETVFGLIGPQDIFLKAVEVPGPVALIPGGDAPPGPEQVDLAARIVLASSDCPGPLGQVEARQGESSEILTAAGHPKADFAQRLVT